MSGLAQESALRIRRMERADAAAAAALEAACFSEPWREADFAQAAQESGVLYLLAEWEGRPAGLCGVRNLAGDGEITNVSVDAALRRRGIAEQMLRRLMREGEKLGIRAYTLEVRRSNAAALALYEKLGFRAEGIRPRFYRKPVEDALILWKRQDDAPSSF